MSVRDLVELMIIVSDNAATNLLTALVGMENLQAYLEKDLRAMKFVGKYEQDFFGQVRRFSYGTLYAEEIALEGRWEGVTEDKLISLFFAEGEGILEAGEEETPFAPGDVFLIPAEAVHYRLEGNARVYLFR